ncbi:hypothetical protein HQQ80_07505 [Microbacteriaceae bacterium VKM Ac-2855]|nr:hypothetical protein [Microbacteriaceae bacterium VKM Ac-2855]
MTDAATLELGKTYFVGDSLTEAGDWGAWLPASEVVNGGTGGTTTADVLAHLPEIIEAAPDTVVILIGTNDLAWHKSTEHIVRNIETTLVTLRRDLPDVRILLQSVLPRAREFAPQIRDVNRHLWQFAPTVHAKYLDLWPTFAQEDGEIVSELSPDRLHLSEAGYQTWLAELAPALDALLRMAPRTRPITLPYDEFSRPATA